MYLANQQGELASSGDNVLSFGLLETSPWNNLQKCDCLPFSDLLCTNQLTDASRE